MKFIKKFYIKHEYKILFTTGLAYSIYTFSTIINSCKNKKLT